MPLYISMHICQSSFITSNLFSSLLNFCWRMDGVNVLIKEFLSADLDWNLNTVWPGQLLI
jgi:hypothetical protein